MDKLVVTDIATSGKKILVRVDFNVPLDESTGAIMDDSRIRAVLPTIEYLIKQNARLILCSHLGSPGGKINPRLSMKPVGERLSQLLGKKVIVAPDCIGPEVSKMAGELKEGDILLLENLRFHAEEETNDPVFAKALASPADIYVDDAFGTAHRNHASITGVAKYLPAAAGLLLEKEINTLGGILGHPARPFMALLGGAKVSDKVGVMANIVGKVDSLLIGGGMAATFLKAKGYEIGQSIFEPDRIDIAIHLMEQTEKDGARVMLPVDFIIAEDISDKAQYKTVKAYEIPRTWRIVDIGPETIERFINELRKCRTVFWNGPMGVYEIPRFAQGTRSLANALANLKATTIIGGGSTAEIVTNMKLNEKMTFVSTGGGASLQFLAGGKLPGVDVLSKREA